MTNDDVITIIQDGGLRDRRPGIIVLSLSITRPHVTATATAVHPRLAQWNSTFIQDIFDDV